MSRKKPRTPQDEVEARSRRLADRRSRRRAERTLRTNLPDSYEVAEAIKALDRAPKEPDSHA